jgi:CxxC-x17-CxxC domain-containing protein
MPFEDKTIVCGDCGQEFIHSAEDQERYAERGFTNEPKRCRPCREKRKAQSQGGGGRGGGGGGGGRGPRDRGGPRPRQGGGGRPARDHGGRQERESFEAVCADCGVVTTLPFKPKGDRPVYCRDCFRARKR